MDWLHHMLDLRRPPCLSKKAECVTRPVGIGACVRGGAQDSLVACGDSQPSEVREGNGAGRPGLRCTHCRGLQLRTSSSLLPVVVQLMGEERLLHFLNSWKKIEEHFCDR